MFDLVKDTEEMMKVYGNPEYAAVRASLTKEYDRLREELEAPTYEKYAPKAEKK
jgi:hypothetical protein